MFLLPFILYSFSIAITPYTSAYNLALESSHIESTSIQFDTKSIISDTLCEGEITDFVYRFKNTGNTSIHILNVRSSCGCYVPEWPKDEILPGRTAEIIGRYSTRYRPGPFARSLTVNYNDGLVQRVMLFVRGYTLPKELCQN